MDTGHRHAKAFIPAIGSMALACLFACPAVAGNNVVQVVHILSDARGNQAWVEIESAGDRKKATPLVAIGDEGVRKLLENPEEKGSLAIPVPRLMRLVERARHAIGELKRPAATAAAQEAPACPETAKAPGAPVGSVGEGREAAPDRTALPAPATKPDTGLSPPPSPYSSAAR